MTPEPVPERRPARAGWLLRLGVRAAISAMFPLLALAGVLAAAQTVQRMLWPALFLADPELRLDDTLLLGGGGCLGLAVLTRAVVTALGVRAGAARLRTGPGADVVAPATAGLRGISWAVAAAIVDLVLSVWFWGVLVAGAVALVLGGPLVSLLGAVGVSLALALGALLGPAAGLWLELGLVVSVIRPGRFSVAAGEALRLLLARPGFLIGAWLVTAVPGGDARRGRPGDGRRGPWTVLERRRRRWHGAAARCAGRGTGHVHPSRCARRPGART